MASSTAHPAPPGFVVEQVHPPQLLVLHSNSFVPAAWRARLGGLIDFSWTWTFALADTGEGGTRLLRILGTDRAVVAERRLPRRARPGRRRPGRQHAGRRPPPSRSPRRRRDDLADGGGVIAGSIGQTEGSPP
jgi:hypothetical protein